MSKKRYVVEITDVTVLVYLEAESEEEACDLAVENWDISANDIILSDYSERTAEIAVESLEGEDDDDLHSVNSKEQETLDE